MDKSPWKCKAPGERYDATPFPTEAEVVIVGAGLTGILTARKLVRAGKHVLVLDMGRVASGETGNSTAHVTWLWDCGYAALRERFSDDAARLALRAHAAAAAELADLARTIRCDYAEVPAYVYANNKEQSDALQDEYAAILELGGAGDLVNTLPLPFTVAGALRVQNSWQCDPCALARGLLETTIGENCRVAEGVRVERVEDKRDGCVVHTSHGIVEAEEVVYASHTPINRFALHTKQAAYRTYVLGLRSTLQVGAGLFMDMESPYHYFRRHSTADGSWLLIVGGADHKTGEKSGVPFHDLELFAEQRFGPSDVQFAWSGQVLEPFDGLPFIGRNPGDHRVHVATGYSGTGISGASLAASIISDAILQEANPWSRLFSPARLKPVTQARYLRENIDVPAHLLLDRLIAHGDVEAIDPNEGALVREGSHTWAVYRDAGSALHAFSPVCPHMGCHVQWNSSEKSWDCPCHGSRFAAATGQVLNGPSTENLHKMQVASEEDIAESPVVRNDHETFKDHR